MIFSKNHYSIPQRSVMRPLVLTHNKDVTLVSDNPRIKIVNGMCYASEDAGRPQGSGTIKAYIDGEEVDSCKITIVSWMANTLEVDTEEIDPYTAMIEAGGVLYGYIGNELYSTIDGFQSRRYVGVSNQRPGKYQILNTMYGFFMRSNSGGIVYRSNDLLDWELCYDDCIGGLFHMFDSYFDNGLLYIYLGEYSAGEPSKSRRHRVIRGIIDSSGNQDWSTIKEFYSSEEYDADNSVFPAANHIHVVCVDQKTGHLYVNSGDKQDECHIFYSRDNGDTWTLISSGVGGTYMDSQTSRALSIWFTDDYVYWNVDSGSPQSIFRMHRDNLPDEDVYQSPFKEEVQMIDNGSLWYHCIISDDAGDSMTIMGQSAEGFRRDGRGRLFSIQEKSDMQVDIRELATTNDSESSGMIQFEPLLQDKNGFIFVNGRGTDFTGTLRCKLVRRLNPLPYTWASGFS